MLSLYFVRHGQTDLSLANSFCGSIDPPLNANGMRMAEALAARYGSERWAAIYASPRLRTRQTAAPTATEAQIDVQIAEGLQEIAYGQWEGRSEEEVQRSEPERFADWSAHPGRVSPPGGETAVDIAARAMPVIESIRKNHSDGKVLVVSHKATLRVILCALLGVDVDLFRARIEQRVAAVSVVEFKKSGPLLQVLGDVSHLGRFAPDLVDSEGT